MPRLVTPFALLVLSSLPGVVSADQGPAEAESAATALLAGWTAADGVAFPDALSFEVRDTFTWAGGTNVRFTQSILGIPVHHHELIVSLASDGSVRRVRGEPLSVVLLDSNAELSPDAAVELADRWVRARFGGLGALFEPTSELRVLIGRDDVPRLIWRVVTSTASPPDNFEVLLDAHTGVLIGAASIASDVRGNIYPTNPIVSTVTEVELLRLETDQPGMQGEYAYVNSCDEFTQGGGGGECTAKSRHAEADADGNFLFSPDPTSSDDPMAEVQMYHHLDRIAEWFDSQHGFSLGDRIEGIVNFDYNNAFYGNFDSDPYGEVAFGQTSAIDFAYDADVIYHEFGHAVFGRIAGQTGFFDSDEYGVEYATGGLNEGTADLFSMVLTGDPELGEYAGAGFGGGGNIRDLEADRHCPTDLFGESHADGEVFGAFGWNLIDDDLLGAEFTGDYIYGSVTAFPVNANWADASEALADTAADMLDEGLIDAAQSEAILEHLRDAGLDDCGRVISLDDGAEPSQLMIAVSLFADQNIPLGNQFSLEAPEGAYRLRMRVTDFLSSDAAMDWNLYVRRGEHIVHELVEVETPFGTLEAPVPDEFDFVIEGEGDGFELELELDSDPPLEPGATYYFSMASRVEGTLGDFFANAVVTVEGDVEAEEIVEEEEEEEEGSGCTACASSVGGAGSGGALAALFLALTAVPRRRRS